MFKYSISSLIGFWGYKFSIINTFAYDADILQSPAIDLSKVLELAPASQWHTMDKQNNKLKIYIICFI